MAAIVLLLALLFVLGAGDTGMLIIAWVFWTVLGWLVLAWMVGHGMVADRFEGWVGRIFIAALLWVIVVQR